MGLAVSIPCRVNVCIRSEDVIVDVLLDRQFEKLPPDALCKHAERTVQHMLQGARKVCACLQRVQKPCVKPDCLFDELAPSC